MTNLEAKKPNNNTAFPTLSRETVNNLKKALRRVLSYVPAAVIVVLIALYYIQLSHMGA